MVLTDFGVTEERILALIDRLIMPGGSAVAEMERQGYTPRARRILERSREEADNFRAASVRGRAYFDCYDERDRLYCYTAAAYNGSEYSENVSGSASGDGRRTECKQGGDSERQSAESFCFRVHNTCPGSVQPGSDCYGGGGEIRSGDWKRTGDQPGNPDFEPAVPKTIPV